jgi:hypothetical protein
VRPEVALVGLGSGDLSRRLHNASKNAVDVGALEWSPAESMKTSNVVPISSLTRNARLSVTFETDAEWVQIPAPPPFYFHGFKSFAAPLPAPPRRATDSCEEFFLVPETPDPAVIGESRSTLAGRMPDICPSEPPHG